MAVAQSRPRGLILGGFALANAAVIGAAAVLRRRAPRKPAKSPAARPAPAAPATSGRSTRPASTRSASPIWSSVGAALKEPWAFAKGETRDLRVATRFLVPSDEPVPPGARSFSGRGQLGRFLRSPRAWPSLTAPLDDATYDELLKVLLDILVGTNILVDVAERGARALQIRREALLWLPGGKGRAAASPPLPATWRATARSTAARSRPSSLSSATYRETWT